MWKFQNKEQYVEKKKSKGNILLFARSQNTDRKYVNGWLNTLYDFFDSQNYNVFVFSNQALENQNFFSPEYNHLNDFKDNILKAKEFQGEDYNLYLHKNFMEFWDRTFSYDEIFKNQKNIVFCFNDYDFFLSLTSYTSQPGLKEKLNEFHDYVGDDEQEIKNIEQISDSVIKKYAKIITPLAFIKRYSFVTISFLKSFDEKYGIHKMFVFVIDPAVFTFYKNLFKAPVHFLYFADDKRGTRNFEKFPIGELQHLVFEKEIENALFEEKVNKTKDFMFAGSIIHRKGPRIKKWEQYFKDFRQENSSLVIPLRIGVIPKRKNFSHGVKGIEDFEDLTTEISSHPQYEGEMIPQKINQKIQKYKYSLILSCVSVSDSLNYRIFNYLQYDILPFLDPEYDPGYLQIPKEFQDQLIVKTSQDIMDKIQYYNDNPSQRISLLNELKEYFEIEKWRNKKHYVDYLKEFEKRYLI